jgi:hypothetical protein
LTKEANGVESYKTGSNMDDLMQTCCRILGLPPGASLDEIKEAFKKIREDLSTREEEWERLKEVSWAYEALIRKLSDRAEDHQEKGGTSRGKIKEEDGSDVKTVKSFLFSVGERINPFFIAGRAFVFILTLIWGFKYMIHSVGSNYAGESFLHNVSLPFHEVGHIIFSPFGDFLTVLGGSLMQLVIPAICIAAFLKREDMFGASIAVWWLGQNFIDLAPYINDARTQELILLGGVTGQDAPGFHDWNNILGTLGLLRLDHLIAQASHCFGILLMITSSLWGGYLLYLQWKKVDL